MRILIATVICAFLALPALAADAPKTDDQKTLYAIGLVVARELAVFKLSPSELEQVKQGITDAVTGKTPLVELSAFDRKIQELAQARIKVYGEKLATTAGEFLERAAREKGAVKTSSGLIFLPLTEGKGNTPTPDSTVRVNYKGTLVDGYEFDSSYRRGKPVEFTLKNVIKCWTEGLQKMQPGGKAKLFCPPAIAYGDRGPVPSIPPQATLVFEIELLDVIK
jgi:FKBP-type peptidyl-prolyl cis-trans isomerase FkpA